MIKRTAKNGFGQRASSRAVSNGEVLKTDGGMPAGPPGVAPQGRLKSAWGISRVLFSRSFLSYWVALCAATLLAWFSSHSSRSGRLSNMDVSQGGFPSSYIMFSKSEEGRGYLVDRRDSTIRRSRHKLPGDSWEVSRFGGDPLVAMPDHWLLRSEKRGAVFFVPVEAVEDKEYPFAYSFVNQEYMGLGLPIVTWAQLYVNRAYNGLYLRVELPFDPRKRDGGSGIRRELLSVRDTELTVVDTAFYSDSRLYADCIAAGVFPELAAPSPALAWLSARKPGAETILLLTNAEPYQVSLLPLPVSLNRLFEKLHSQDGAQGGGGSLPSTTDERYLRWTEGQWARGSLDGAPFDPDRQARFDTQLKEYNARFRAALKVHQSVQSHLSFAALFGGGGDHNVELSPNE